MKRNAATQLRSGTRRETPPRGRVVGWEQRLDPLPERIGQQSVHETGSLPGAFEHQPEALKPPDRHFEMST
jgi:hypothetical protein